MLRGQKISLHLSDLARPYYASPTFDYLYSIVQMTDKKRDVNEAKDEGPKRVRRQFLAPPPEPRHPRVGNDYQVSALPEPATGSPTMKHKEKK